MRPGNARRLAAIQHELQLLAHGVEPRKVAQQILLLLDEQDRLRVAGGSHVRCAHCHETFVPPRVDSRHCSRACRQAAYRQRVTDHRKSVTPLADGEPRYGGTASSGRRAGPTTATATQGQGAAA